MTHALNKRYRNAHMAASCGSGHPIAAFIPMDGYHLTRAQLSAMPDPHTAHARRGAAFTFDAGSFVELVKALRAPITPESRTVYAPSFDHAVKDPVEKDISIAQGVRVVVFEGNYVALDEGAWREARDMMDECWFVDVEEDVAARRLVRRHVATGIAANEEEAMERVRNNDLVNGRQIRGNRSMIDEMVASREDKEWLPENQGVDHTNG